MLPLGISSMMSIDCKILHSGKDKGKLSADNDDADTSFLKVDEEAIAVSNNLLASPNEPERCHMELKLHNGMNPKAGDYRICS